MERPVCATEGEETWTNRVTPAARAARRSPRVPSTLTARKSSGSPASETLAARCTTASTPSTARATAAGSVTLPRWSTTAPGTGSAPLVERPDGWRWKVRTACPADARRSATARPSIPLAPVTSTITGRSPGRP
ncbi:hypothetical protein BC477_01595 [Clavibacter michiganensis subsp. michiganensis]|uniref:Uncharacterized protein n=1 Tax=Clavibacter michiganensis subsp. michiganensis TaxID=33013 RepID=A0A251XIZ9_CLAMM|nr:hypothetical protein BC477_01595 [Clavibacter michiganensis subsp. michiganensis]OUE03401.1 hypothetical protein CMMCAS07_00530 [Clavibacter michiganensis subsp. michiganensis]